MTNRTFRLDRTIDCEARRIIVRRDRIGLLVAMESLEHHIRHQHDQECRRTKYPISTSFTHEILHIETFPNHPIRTSQAIITIH